MPSHTLPSRLRRRVTDPRTLDLLQEAWSALGARHWSRSTIETTLASVLVSPEQFRDEPALAELATHLAFRDPTRYPERDLGDWPNLSGDPRNLLEARRLPIAVYGAILPGRQAGYGLPVGAVLATKGAVIPRAVGRDIGCRVHLSAFPSTRLDLSREVVARRLARLLRQHTRFGLEGIFDEEATEHPVFKDPAWVDLEVLRRFRDTARQRFGSSGTGNHFVDLGVLRLPQVAEGRPCLALLTHSGSRGLGETVALHFHRQARQQRGRLTRELREWAWLDLDSQDGQDYFQAMQLCQRYTLACHEWLHARLAEALEVEPGWSLSCPHNLATLESWRGETVVVHRKGAIRLGPGEAGMICGSQTAPTHIVEGLDDDATLHSASHGAGRVMSRSTAHHAFRRRELDEALRAARVTLVSHHQDEWPGVYRDIDSCLAAHSGFAVSLGTFQPGVVRMCSTRDRSED